MLRLGGPDLVESRWTSSFAHKARPTNFDQCPSGGEVFGVGSMFAAGPEPLRFLGKEFVHLVVQHLFSKRKWCFAGEFFPLVVRLVARATSVLQELEVLDIARVSASGE